MGYLDDVGMAFDDLARMDKSEIKGRIRDYDNRLWEENLNKLTDRDVYKRYKSTVGGSFGYDKSEESDLLFRARSNTLGLNDFNVHIGGETRYEMCDADWEDLEHFLLNCPYLNRARNKDLIKEVGEPGARNYRKGNIDILLT